MSEIEESVYVEVPDKQIVFVAKVLRAEDVEGFRYATCQY
jgi:hypothetical protein